MAQINGDHDIFYQHIEWVHKGYMGLEGVQVGVCNMEQASSHRMVEASVHGFQITFQTSCLYGS